MLSKSSTSLLENTLCLPRVSLCLCQELQLMSWAHLVSSQNNLTEMSRMSNQMSRHCGLGRCKQQINRSDAQPTFFNSRGLENACCLYISYLRQVSYFEYEVPPPPQLVALFQEVLEPLGGVSQRKEAGRLCFQPELWLLMPPVPDTMLSSTAVNRIILNQESLKLSAGILSQLLVKHKQDQDIRAELLPHN